ncbi:MAG: RNA polymerase sigma factor [Acidobacteriota bacterium]|nr:sigma-70 family RNA polymerase sigma factor [Bryobacteraceae bacterium]
MYPGSMWTPDAGSEPSDDNLLELARGGDAASFGKLIERHYRPCFRLALSIVRNRGDAEDEVQNACWKAWERLWQYQAGGTFSAWLSRIVSNQCLMRIRQRRCSRIIRLDDPIDSDGRFRLELIDQGALAEEQLGDREISEVLHREIRRIPPLLRNVMLLRDVQQLPMPDVAARLGLSVPAAKSRLMRARIELHSRLRKRCGEGAVLVRPPRQRRAAYVRAA